MLKSRRLLVEDTEQAGFTMVELAVVLVVIALLGGVLMTQLVGRTTQARAATLAESMGTLGDAVQIFRGDVGRYPRRLMYLSEPPVAGATDLCNRPIPTGALGEWRGPYVDRRVLGYGIPSGDGYIANQLRRDPADLTGGSYGMLFIDATGVDEAVARIVDRAVDGGVTFTTGSVRWAAAAGGTLSYGVPVRGC